MSSGSPNIPPNPTFDQFKQLATDPTLSSYQKIGFPDAYRKDKGPLIFQDIVMKLPQLNASHQVVLDIGPGCSDLPQLLIHQCEAQAHQLLLVDSAEMLSLLPDQPFIRKFPGYFPACPALFEGYLGKVDVLLSYSVLHHVFAESNLWDFFDSGLQLLREGGAWLIGDIPNVSKRKRFFSSENGVKYHQAFTGTDTLPDPVVFNQVEKNVIDDGVLFGLMLRARNQGFDAYLLPQGAGLPFENRREDLLIRRP